MDTRKRKSLQCVAAASILLTTLACGSLTGTDESAPPDAPTITPPSQAAAETATPVPDVSGPGGCTLNAGYVADVTVPDDTVFAPGTAFVKTWRVKNTGTCDWEAGTQLVYVSGEPMGGPPAVDVPSVAPDATTDISVNFVAPSAPGTYRSTWQMKNTEGTFYGSQIYVQIIVPSPATDTPIPPTAEPPTAVPPTAPPAPPAMGGGTGRIAYVSFRDGNAEIYTMVGDDSSPNRLTDSPEIDDWPDFSPDGSKIVFTRYHSGKPDVYVMNADGSFQTNLTNSSSSTDSQPAWSPDGTRIAFHSNRGGGNLQIYVMNADGTNVIQLTNTPELNSSPDWSPDGNFIVFESMRDGQREIYKMNADGSGPTQLTTTGGNYGPEWSPNGNRIVFSTGSGLWTVKPDGTAQTNITSGSDFHPHWSPDGSLILYDSQISGNWDLYVVNADGTNPQQLTTNSAMDANATWQP